MLEKAARLRLGQWSEACASRDCSGMVPMVGDAPAEFGGGPCFNLEHNRSYARVGVKNKGGYE